MSDKQQLKQQLKQQQQQEQQLCVIIFQTLLEDYNEMLPSRVLCVVSCQDLSL